MYVTYPCCDTYLILNLKYQITLQKENYSHFFAGKEELKFMIQFKLIKWSHVEKCTQKD